jgi:hypothetical protein
LLHSRIYVDSRLHSTLFLEIKESFWDRGDFPAVVQNGSEVVGLQNPWINGTKAAPFDQRMFSMRFFLLELIRSLGFYLILDVGIGGTNGWFPDDPDKPWLDGSKSKSITHTAHGH